jgi:hypothetical protein
MGYSKNEAKIRKKQLKAQVKAAKARAKSAKVAGIQRSWRDNLPLYCAVAVAVGIILWFIQRALESTYG